MLSTYLSAKDKSKFSILTSRLLLEPLDSSLLSRLLELWEADALSMCLSGMLKNQDYNHLFVGKATTYQPMSLSEKLGLKKSKSRDEKGMQGSLKWVTKLSQEIEKKGISKDFSNSYLLCSSSKQKQRTTCQ